DGRTLLRGHGISLRVAFDEGIDPVVRLSWQVEPRKWKAGASLIGFHSTEGFCPQSNPPDLNQHGRMIIESTHDGDFDTQVAEGWHYFTFVLVRPIFKGMFQSTGQPLRFSRNVRALKNALSRIQDMEKLNRLKEEAELAPLLHEVRM